jgi:hypothetical protein
MLSAELAMKTENSSVENKPSTENKSSTQEKKGGRLAFLALLLASGVPMTVWLGFLIWAAGHLFEAW